MKEKIVYNAVHGARSMSSIKAALYNHGNDEGYDALVAATTAFELCVLAALGILSGEENMTKEEEVASDIFLDECISPDDAVRKLLELGKDNM